MRLLDVKLRVSDGCSKNNHSAFPFIRIVFFCTPFPSNFEELRIIHQIKTLGIETVWNFFQMCGGSKLQVPLAYSKSHEFNTPVSLCVILPTKFNICFVQKNFGFYFFGLGRSTCSRHILQSSND